MSIHDDIQTLCAELVTQAALPLAPEHLDALQDRAQRLLGLLAHARVELEVEQNLEANVARLDAVLEASDVPETDADIPPDQLSAEAVLEASDVPETDADIPPDQLSAEAAREYARRIAQRRALRAQDSDDTGAEEKLES